MRGLSPLRNPLSDGEGFALKPKGGVAEYGTVGITAIHQADRCGVAAPEWAGFDS
jgi:hypothetical protein